jgi:hypothetical protein
MLAFHFLTGDVSIFFFFLREILLLQQVHNMGTSFLTGGWDLDTLGLTLM